MWGKQYALEIRVARSVLSAKVKRIAFQKCKSRWTLGGMQWSNLAPSDNAAL
jgi:hypothetical protein